MISRRTAIGFIENAYPNLHAPPKRGQIDLYKRGGNLPSAGAVLHILKAGFTLENPPESMRNANQSYGFALATLLIFLLFAHFFKQSRIEAKPLLVFQPV